jgi:hypothetical protein
MLRGKPTGQVGTTEIQKGSNQSLRDDANEEVQDRCSG